MSPLPSWRAFIYVRFALDACNIDTKSRRWPWPGTNPYLKNKTSLLNSQLICVWIRASAFWHQMPGGEPFINGQFIVVIEYGGVTLGEEYLALTIHRDVSDTEQDRIPESDCNSCCVFYRVFPILLQGTDMSDVTSDLFKSLSKSHVQRKASNSINSNNSRV